MFQVEGDSISFGGFASHRNEYSFFVGIALILTTIIKMTYKIKIPIYLILIILINMSESRSTLIAVFVSIVYYLSKIKKNKILIYLMILFLFVASSIYFLYYGSRSEGATNINDRLDITQFILKSFKGNILFGQGEPVLLKGYSDTGEDLPAHNFLIQTIIDYGLLILLPFLLLLLNIWLKFNTAYKTFLIYIIIIGLFQPYFSFGVPTYFTLIIFILAIVANNYENNLTNTIILEQRFSN